MTQAQLEDAVAEATGESARLIRDLGFGLGSCALEPEDLRLVVACPHCGRPVAYPGTASDGAAALAECLDCDAYFGFAPCEVHASGVHDANGPVPPPDC